VNRRSAIAAGFVLAAVIVAFGVYQYRLRQEAKRWEGPFREIVEEKIEHDDGVTRSRFVAILPAPVQQVEAVVWQVERLQEFVPNFKISRLIEAKGNTKIVELGIQALSLPLLRYEMEFTLHPQEHRVTFRTLKSQAQDIEGEYRLEASPDGSKTRVTYSTVARDKVAVPFPRSVLDSAGRETFVNTVRGIEKLLLGQRGIG
jgi:ribosome-associated toxin RatA of RatAB toxin-antitoxin module